MNFPKAVLFDLDDTILASEESMEASWRQVCAELAADHPAIRANDFHREVQAYREWYWSDAARHQAGRLNPHRARAEIAAAVLERLGVNAPELPARVAANYYEISHANLAPFPRALETLEWFRGRHVPLGLITNGTSEVQRRKINQFALAGLFQLIVVEEEFGAGKPDPAVFRYALSELGVKAQETWMVGDRLDWDVGPPQELGIHGVWNDFRKRGLPHGSLVKPKRIVHSIAELMS